MLAKDLLWCMPAPGGRRRGFRPYHGQAGSYPQAHAKEKDPGTKHFILAYSLRQFEIGGTDGIRTRDLLRDKQVLVSALCK